MNEMHAGRKWCVRLLAIFVSVDNEKFA